MSKRRIKKRSEVFEIIKNNRLSAAEKAVLKKEVKKEKDLKRDKIFMMLISLLMLVLALNVREEWQRTITTFAIFFTSIAGIYL